MTLTWDPKYIRAPASNIYKMKIIHLLFSLSFPIGLYSMTPFNNPMILNVILHLARLWCLEIKWNWLNLVKDEGLSPRFVSKNFFHREMNSVDISLLQGLRRFLTLLPSSWLHSDFMTFELILLFFLLVSVSGLTSKELQQVTRFNGHRDNHLNYISRSDGLDRLRAWLYQQICC